MNNIYNNQKNNDIHNHNNEHEYHFGVPNEFIWVTHILMGLFFIYVGYAILKHWKIQLYIALTVVVLGALGLLYHSHLWYERISNK